MADDYMQESKMRDIAHKVFDERIKDFKDMYGFADVDLIRSNNYWIKGKRAGEEGVKNESRRMIFAIVGGFLSAIAGAYIGMMKMGGH